LDKALTEADIPRATVYLTNAVKHFKWIQRGKRRMHQKPLIRQITACKPWLEAELEIIRPKLIVCLGATAAQAVLGAGVRISQDRGKIYHTESGYAVCVTAHPAAVYRQRDRDQQEQEYRRFLADIKLVRHHLT
jgi:DNA polymerase